MCGIILQYNSKEDLKPCLDEMKHRGKDYSSVDEYDNCTVGYRRLAITGDYKKNGVYLNGEIYNYKELGYKGNENEVIKQGIEKEGLEFITKLNGMFLIVAIINGQIWVSRDRYGIKPCYYFKHKDTVIISSEIKPILKHPLYKFKINNKAKRQWLTFNNYLTDDTLFEGIYRLGKGTIYNVAYDKAVRFWRWNFTPQEIEYKEAVKKVRELVIQAIKRQIPSICAR
jgi:asparagine synthase (glutamine-hydrolysing)